MIDEKERANIAQYISQDASIIPSNHAKLLKTYTNLLVFFKVFRYPAHAAFPGICTLFLEETEGCSPSCSLPVSEQIKVRGNEASKLGIHSILPLMVFLTLETLYKYLLTLRTVL